MRDCERCIHNIGGRCNSWDCEFETLDMREKKAKIDVLHEMKEFWNERMASTDNGDFAMTMRVLVAQIDMKIDELEKGA